MVAAHDRRSPRPCDGGEQVLDPIACLEVVLRVEVDGRARRFLGVAHTPQHPTGFAWPPVDSGCHVERHRHVVDVEIGGRGGDHDLVAGAARRDARACRRADLAQLRAAGQHDPVGVDRAGGGIDSDDAAAVGAQPGEGAPLADVDAVRGERGGVRQHVSWCVDVAVARRVRGAHRDARRQTGVTRVDVVAAPPLDIEAEAALQSDAVMRLLHFGRCEARHQITLRDEAAVEWEPITAGEVEVLGLQTQSDRGLGAALRAHHARGTAACPVAEGCRFDAERRSRRRFRRAGRRSTRRPSHRRPPPHRHGRNWS